MNPVVMAGLITGTVLIAAAFAGHGGTVRRVALYLALAPAFLAAVAVIAVAVALTGGRGCITEPDG